MGDVTEALRAVRGTDYGIHTAAWISRFTDVTRQATTYRERRVLLAGDAAHVHLSIGGHGLNTAIQDAVNLGWKLAQVVDGTSPESLLDTYHDERHPVGARMLHNTLAQTALIALCWPDIHYELGEGHPLLYRGCAVLLNFGAPLGVDISPWAHRVTAIDATYDGPWELPALGRVPAPRAVLVRPDGHVAWVGDGTDTALKDALTIWFGPGAAH